MDLGVSGLASGFDWRSLVDQLSDVERLPQNRLRVEQQGLRERNAAYDSLVSELTTLRTQATNLTTSSAFLSRTASVDDSSAARVNAQPGAPEGVYSFHFTQLATAAKTLGQSGVGQTLSPTNDVSSLVLADAAFTTAVTAGTFTVNGRQITLNTTDTLQEVFDKISTATDGTVAGVYDATTDRISLTGPGELVLGSATDTSNFLQVARLSNNGSELVTSYTNLGGVRLTRSLDDAGLLTPVSDGGAGEGRFRVNGVEIAFSRSDSVEEVLARISDSGAGVQAGYDALSDRFQLVNRTTGDLGMALEDVNGNFLAATGLISGTLQRGKDLLYTVDGGDTLRSRSNTIDETSSSLAGLTVTALREGTTTTVSVGTDTSTIQAALHGFVEQYNKVQALIDTQTAISTDADGTVTAGVLSRDSEVGAAGRRLRALVFAPVTGLEGGANQLQALGYDTGHEDNRLTLKDAEALTRVLATHPSRVHEMFTHATNGLAVQFNAFLDTLVGEEGSLISSQDSLTRQTAAIDQQVIDLERLVQRNRAQMIESFIAMEQAQSQSNQQLQFLMQRFGTTTS